MFFFFFFFSKISSVPNNSNQFIKRGNAVDPLYIAVLGRPRQKKKVINTDLIIIIALTLNMIKIVINHPLVLSNISL